MPFTIEFQPLGLRLKSENPINALDAARQAGITLSAVCGGEGTCGKCVIQILSNQEDLTPSPADRKHFSDEQTANGFRLACMTFLDKDTKIYIPASSIIEDQVMQTEGGQEILSPKPAVTQRQVSLQKPALNDPASDFSRIKEAVGSEALRAGIAVLRRIPHIVRENNWRINLVLRGNELMQVTPHKLEEPLGLAVDVGSTKIACYLVDLETARVLTAKGTPNPQIAFGEDIMARLAYAIQDPANAEKLHTQTIQAINNAAAAMCKRIGRESDEIADICLVGNTAMHHFYLNLPTASLAVSPFVPAFADPLNLPAAELGLESMPGAAVYIPPVKAGFIGSDHLAFLYAANFNRDSRIKLGIDIGTNTEIALQAAGRIVSVSTASGPAFEGAHITYGMRAAPGAIEHVWIDENWRPTVDVIQGGKTTGICGSGILDAIAQMRMRGIINGRGRFVKEGKSITMDASGKPAFALTRDSSPITLSQHDIDQILLAKGAIRAGIDILMDHLDIKVNEIEEVDIAGAFGSYMLPEHAIGIGMLPEIPLEKIKVAGNAAGTGARMMLANIDARLEAEQLAEKIEYLELTIYPEFALFYANGIRA